MLVSATKRKALARSRSIGFSLRPQHCGPFPSEAQREFLQAGPVPSSIPSQARTRFFGEGWEENGRKAEGPIKGEGSRGQKKVLARVGSRKNRPQRSHQAVLDNRFNRRFGGVAATRKGRWPRAQAGARHIEAGLN